MPLLSQPQRWTPNRKAEVLKAIREGEFTRTDALERYDLSHEELTGWERAHARRGQRGLAVTKLQEMRHG